MVLCASGPHGCTHHVVGVHDTKLHRFHLLDLHNIEHKSGGLARRAMLQRHHVGLRREEPGTKLTMAEEGRGRGEDLRIAMTEPLHDTEHRGSMRKQQEAPPLCLCRRQAEAAAAASKLRSSAHYLLQHFTQTLGNFDMLALMEKETSKTHTC